MSNLQIENRIDDFNFERWEFYFSEHSCSLLLNYYTLYSRKGKRHNYTRVKFYSRLSQRDSTIPVNEAPLPDTVIEQAKTIFFNKLTVTK